MTDKNQILGDSPERVALDLALKTQEQRPPVKGPDGRDANPPPLDEAAWLALYRRCLEVVRQPVNKGDPPVR